MTRDDLLKELRSVVDDAVRPYGWSDTRLINFLSEGQDKFCEQTGFWSDKSTYSITTLLNETDYAIPARVIAVRSVWDGARELVDGAQEKSPAVTTDTQRPLRYRTDLETGVLSLLEPPLADIVLSLRVHRRSKIRFSVDDAELEIPEEFHLGVVEYAAYKAFGDHDRELQDPVKARDHLLNFKQYVKDGARAYRRITGEYIDVVPNQLYVV